MTNEQMQAQEEFEQQERYDELAEATSESLAYFYCCIAFDRPFELNAVPTDGSKKRWLAYLDNLRAKELDVDENGTERGFLDGMTQITQIFGKTLTDGEFCKTIGIERSAKGKQEGTALQRKTWGFGDEIRPYTGKDYKRLDELFATYSSRLEKAGGYDTQQEYTLRLCARMSLEMEKALSKGGKENIAQAKTLSDMIQAQLSSENLRKKDEKPVEELRIDSIVDALEKGGLMKKGKLLSLPELQKALLERLGALGGKPSHKYPYSLDAADQMILAIKRTMAANDGLPEPSELPDNMCLDENVACEFADEPNQDELANYEEMGLFRRR